MDLVYVWLTSFFKAFKHSINQSLFMPIYTNGKMFEQVLHIWSIYCTFNFYTTSLEKT